MSLKQRLAYRLKECFSVVGSRSESLSPPRRNVDRPDAAPGSTPRVRMQLGHWRGGGAGRMSEAHLAQLGLARKCKLQNNQPGLSPLVVEQLLGTLKTGDDEERHWAAEMVLELALESEDAPAATSLKATVAPLLKMLHSDAPRGRLCAAAALSALAGLEDSRGEMERQGAVKPLVAMLKAQATPADGKKSALRALERLARSDVASHQICSLGGLKPIVGLLDAGDMSLVKRSLIALYFVGADKEDLQIEILKAGALQSVLDLCKSSHQSVQSEAVDVCKVLSRSKMCSVTMADQGAVEVLVKVVGEGLSERARNTALQTLQRMSESSANLKAKISKLGTVLRFDDLSDDEISELVGIFSSGDDHLRAQAAKVVEQVAAADPKASRDLAEPEIVSSLIDLLTTGSDEGRSYASWAIARLVEDVSVRDKVYMAGAVHPLLAILRDGGQRSQEGAACALQKLASHKAAATEIVQGDHLPSFLSALDTGTDRTQVYVTTSLFLLRGVDPIVQDQLLQHGGASVLVRRSWRGTAEVQALAVAVLHDLCQTPANQKILMSSGAVPALLNLGSSKIKDVADMSCESLKHLGSDEYRSEVDAEIILQDQITDMLQMVLDRGIRVKRLVEEAIRLVPRGMFVEPHKVEFAYSSDAVLVTELDMELAPMHIHVIMLDALQLEPGHSFLEVGCATGFLVCLAAYMVSPAGRAIGLEGDAGACAFAESQAEKLVSERGLGELHPRFLVGDVSQLFENVDRFDRIAVSTSFARSLLGELLTLLKPSGRIVVPCEGQLLLIREELGLIGAEVLCAHDPNDGCHTDTSERILLSSDELSSAGYPTYTRTPTRIPLPSPAASSFARRALGASRIPNVRRGSDDESLYFSASHGSASGRRRHNAEADGSKSSRSQWRSIPRNSSQARAPNDPPGASPRNLKRESSRTSNQEKSRDKGKTGQKKSGSKNKNLENGTEDRREEITPDLKGLILSLDDIKICRNGDGKKCRLGEGGFGMVYKAIMNNVDEVAVKVVKTEKPSHKELDLFLQEVKTLSSLHHRNIVQFYGACLEPDSLFFVTELMRGGDLYSALRNHKETMRWERLGKKVALDVALGVNYLHSQKPPMMHRDLKSPNVLLSEEGVAKIADVGMVKEQVKELVTAQPVMTPLWAAPEVMRKERACIKADVWSYGVLIWELVSGEDITDFQPLAMSRQVPSDKGRIMKIPDEAPDVAKKIFFECTQLKASDRPAMQNIVEWLRADGRR